MNEEFDNSVRGKINLIFTTDKHIRQLNKDFRSRNKPTDVLSFNFEKPSRENTVFGEIYISVGTARRQALTYGNTLNQEFLRLACHGLLHVLGYDHIKVKDRTKMESREKYFLNTLTKN